MFIWEFVRLFWQWDGEHARVHPNCAFVHIPIDAISIHNENKAKRTNNNKNSSGGSSSCSDSETRLHETKRRMLSVSKIRNESEYLFIQREIVRANILCLMVALQNRPLQNHAWWSLAIWLADFKWMECSVIACVMLSLIFIFPSACHPGVAAADAVAAISIAFSCTDVVNCC